MWSLLCTGVLLISYLLGQQGEMQLPGLARGMTVDSGDCVGVVGSLEKPVVDPNLSPSSRPSSWVCEERRGGCCRLRPGSLHPVDASCRRVLLWLIKRLRGDLIARCWCLKGGYREDGDSLVTRGLMEKMRDNGCKLLLGRCRWDTREIFHKNNQPLG